MVGLAVAFYLRLLGTSSDVNCREEDSDKIARVNRRAQMFTDSTCGGRRNITPARQLLQLQRLPLLWL